MTIRRLSNPPNPWRTSEIEWIGEAPPSLPEVFEEEARSILSKNDSPDLGFRWSMNPYRGCHHACAYCYARVTHEYLDWGAGSDFEQKIVVKTNARRLLRQAFENPRWAGELVVLSGATDAYQPLEAHYGLTRSLLEVLDEYRNPVGIITKSSLIRRDADVLASLHARAEVRCYVSIPFLDPAVGRAIEPTAPAPSARFAAIRALSDAGIPVGVAIAPIIVGLNDADVPLILERAAEEGATSAFRVPLRLPGSVEPVFTRVLQEKFPDRTERVLSALDEVTGEERSGGGFGTRFGGRGARWQIVDQLFKTSCKRLGLEIRRQRDAHAQAVQTFRRPGDLPGLFERS